MGGTLWFARCRQWVTANAQHHGASSLALDPADVEHGSALWVLRELGFSEGASDVTFNYYIKSLRKLGIPFASGQSAHWPGRLARYSFEHLMELALVLALRVYGAVPNAVLEGIIAHRAELNAIYRRAYRDRDRVVKAHVRGRKGRAAVVILKGSDLDLRIIFSGGQLVSFGPPRMLLPHEAIRSLAGDFLVSRASLPVHISHLAERLLSPPAHRPSGADLRALWPTRNGAAFKSGLRGDPCHSCGSAGLMGRAARSR